MIVNIQREWLEYLKQQGEGLPHSDLSVLSDLCLFYIYHYPKSKNEFWSVMFRGKEVWLYLDRYDNRVYGLDDTSFRLFGNPLGQHTEDNFDHKDIKEVDVLTLLSLEGVIQERELFEKVITSFQTNELAEQLAQLERDRVSKELGKRFEKFKQTFDASKITTELQEDWVYLVFPDGEKVKYKQI